MSSAANLNVTVTVNLQRTARASNRIQDRRASRRPLVRRAGAARGRGRGRRAPPEASSPH